MEHSLLYYPTIEFRAEDYQRLWTAALFADRIYRIVPPGYTLSEPCNIKTLCSTGEIGIPLSPLPYSQEASQEFADFLRENRHKACALSLIDREETEYIRLHSSKMDVKLLQDVFYDLKGWDKQGDWLYANPGAANFYMVFLANHIARKNALTLWTGSPDLWTASAFFLYDGDIQDIYCPEQAFSQPSQSALVSILIPDVFPQNLLAVPPEDILRFREKRRDQRKRFLDAVDHLRAELSKADSPDVTAAILREEKKQVDAAVRDYQKSMDILKAARFGGVLTTVLSLTADALGYTRGLPSLCKNALTSSGLWVGILTGLLKSKPEPSPNPYTYLAHIHSSFSFYSGTFNQFSGLLPRYQYTLSRGFEEFIAD